MRTRHIVPLAAALLLPLAALAGSHAALRSDPIAVIVRIAGEVHVERSGETRAAAVGQRLEDGDRILVDDGARVVLLHRGGRLETLEADRTLAAPASAVETGLFRRTVQALASAAALDPRALPAREGMIRPIPGTAVAIAPRNGVLLLETEPTFTWFRIDAAAGYLVQIRADGGRPTRFTVGPDTVWTLPADAALANGTQYEWTVAALPAGRPAALQRFRIADDAERAAIARTFDELRTNGAEPTGDGALLAALALHDAGALYAARAALVEIVDNGLPLSAELWALLAEVHARLGDGAAAEAALRRAGAGG